MKNWNLILIGLAKKIQYTGVRYPQEENQISRVLNKCCCCYVASVVSDSVRPQRWQPTRLPRPWDSLGKNTGVG